MKLKRLTERIWYFPFEEERDRPNLCYIKGDHWSLSVDAGHSDAHTAEFYRALEDAGLPLPALTALTHWHWDHTFGMHAVHGLCVANARTDEHLRAFREQVMTNGPGSFLSLHESIRREYAGGRPVVITPADIVFSGELLLDPGSCPIRLFQVEAPHTDDSTLIHVIDENVLFLGDAGGDVFLTGERDAALCRKLADSIEATGAELCLEGHWVPTTRQDVLADLLLGMTD